MLKAIVTDIETVPAEYRDRYKQGKDGKYYLQAPPKESADG